MLMTLTTLSKGGYKDPESIANQIKEDGHTIMTVAYVETATAG
jgi:hypothetical protein